MTITYNIDKYTTNRYNIPDKTLLHDGLGFTGLPLEAAHDHCRHNSYT